MQNNSDYNQAINQDIESFAKEKKRFEAVLDTIAGNKTRKIQKVVNILFLVVLVALFVIDVLSDILPPFISLQIGILLVSIKIIWMIHINAQFQHFQFWVLNTLEQKMNRIEREVQKINKK